ncbi:hypothetical protein O181_092014 [Austropuccinia psidii MF-1]|uniref:Uncharacterized protein n=1 Tax=Austropuccinia psidii MF-1 TaxID=1389203 RepID=A0A9Q3IYG4_9BASI|nr:hypothetical protein [Austropuccinia psidii MF-1]
MTHTLTYHSIQNVQLRHHHVGRGMGPYTPAPAQEHAHTRQCNQTAPAPAALCGGLQPCHLLMLSSFMATHHLALVCPSHTHPHPPYCAAGSTSVICKMTILQRQSPFMDELVKSNPPPLHQDWQKDLFDLCVQTGRCCVIFTTLQMVAGE